jgi:hypothetical protein
VEVKGGDERLSSRLRVKYTLHESRFMVARASAASSTPSAAR